MRRRKDGISREPLNWKLMGKKQVRKRWIDIVENDFGRI